MKNEKSYKHDIVFPKNGKSVSIIGAGASGLTLRLLFSAAWITMWTCTKPTMRRAACWCMVSPNTGCPRDVLEHEVRLIEQTGVAYPP